MTNIEKFRPGTATASGWILILFFAGFIVQTLIYGGDLVTTVAICTAGIISSYLLFLKPYLLIFDEGIKIVNPTKEIMATWNLVEEIETKFSMSILINGTTHYAWAAPLQVVDIVEECTRVTFIRALRLPDVLETPFRVIRELPPISQSSEGKSSPELVCPKLRSVVITGLPTCVQQSL